MFTKMKVPISLDKVAQQIEEETRMVLPGIQTLFGFQLIAIFNQRFKDLPFDVQLVHFLALLCSSLAIIIVLIPAAYHRQAEPEEISTFFCRLGTRMLTLSMIPLGVGTCLDLYVIGFLIFPNPNIALSLAILFFALFGAAWFLFPQLLKRRWGLG